MGTIDLPLKEDTSSGFLTEDEQKCITYWNIDTGPKITPAVVHKISQVLKNTPAILAPDLDFNQK
mgnify:FL=1